MTSKSTPITLECKIHRDIYSIKWRIENFHLMPFLEEHHPVCGPSILLGTIRDTTWSLFMTKEHNHGVNNVGFKLVRRTLKQVWDMVTFSISVEKEDGRLIKAVDKVFIGAEDENPYVYLIRPSKNTVSYSADASTQVENGQGKTTPKAKLSDAKSALTNGLEALKITSCSSIESEVEIVKEEPKVKVYSLKTEKGISEAVSPTITKEDPKNTWNPEVKVSDIELTSEELSNFKDLTVVFDLEYTYMVSDCVDMISSEYGLKEDIRQLLFSSEQSDITLKIKDIEIPCHKLVLMSRSDHFKKTLKDETSPTVDIDIKENIAKQFIEFLYTDDISEELQPEEYGELSKLADQFNVHGLKKYCLEILKECDECDLEE